MADENEGVCQYELDRLARIAENKKRMQDMGIFAIADSLFKTCTVPKKPQQPRAKKVYVDAGPVRQSDRQRNKPAVSYCDDYRLERIERQPKTNSRQQRRMPVGARMPNFPIQSAAAIKLATDAAKAKVAELGGRGFFKEMQPSNVSSGYWLQLPVDMGTAYHFPHTADIELECLDECRNDGGWQYQKHPEKNNSRWHVRWLVRGGNSCGLSGGWRGFSIDQQLTWNDTVVFEVPQDVPEGELPTYVIIHTYRAENYETPETEALVVPAKEVFEALMAKLPRDEDEDNEGNLEEGTPSDAPDGDQAAGDSRAADKEKNAALKARKKRIAEVAGSLKTAAAEHKRQKKAGAAAAETDAPAEEADEDMTEADADAEPADGGAAAEATDAGDNAALAAPKAKRGAKQSVVAKGKENARKPPRPKQVLRAKKENEENNCKVSKAAASTKKKAPAKIEPAEPEPDAEEEAPEGVEEEDAEVFFVREVLGARKLRTRRPEFLIRWWNYSPEHDSWEPLDCLDADPFTYDWGNAAAKEAARKHAHKWI